MCLNWFRVFVYLTLGLEVLTVWNLSPDRDRDRDGVEIEILKNFECFETFFTCWHIVIKTVCRPPLPKRYLLRLADTSEAHQDLLTKLLKRTFCISIENLVETKILPCRYQLGLYMSELWRPTENPFSLSRSIFANTKKKFQTKTDKYGRPYFHEKNRQT